MMIVLCALSLSSARIELQTNEETLSLGISGDAWNEAGQLVKYFNQSIQFDHTFIDRTFLHLTIDAIINDRLFMSFGTEGELWFNFPKQRGTGQATYVHRANNYYVICDAEGSYRWGDVQSPFLSITAGLFPYKYNPQVRNLGEYLFRSGTYPAFLINNFDKAFARLTGAKLSSDLFGMLHQDLIYSIETTIPPFFDGTLSYIADCNFYHFVDIGLGVSFANIVSADGRKTTPTNTTSGGPLTQNRYVTEDGDTAYYTFRGTKVMGRVCIDPKKLIPLALFGKEDLKLYAEAAVLGLENYPRNDTASSLYPLGTPGKNQWGYDTLKHKIPVVMGFNVPTFKLLDVLAVEAEWYGCTYPNSYRLRLGPGPNQGYPVPDPMTNHPNINYNADNWKWSVYIKRTFYNEHIGIIAQFARDHVRNETVIDESFDYEEALSANEDWWWSAKVVAQF
jgi:hypothetical protein